MLSERKLPCVRTKPILSFLDVQTINNNRYETIIGNGIAILHGQDEDDRNIVKANCGNPVLGEHVISI